MNNWSHMDNLNFCYHNQIKCFHGIVMWNFNHQLDLTLSFCMQTQKRHAYRVVCMIVVYHHMSAFLSMYCCHHGVSYVKEQRDILYRGLMCAFGKLQRVFHPWSLWMIWRSHTGLCVCEHFENFFDVYLLESPPVCACAHIWVTIWSNLLWSGGSLSGPTPILIHHLSRRHTHHWQHVTANGWQESIAWGSKSRLLSNVSTCQHE